MTPAKEGIVSFTQRLPEELDRRARVQAAMTDRSRQQYIEAAVEFYTKHLEKKQKEKKGLGTE
jgi:predicted transcriptional regulator